MSAGTNGKTRVFVYGTLLSGEPNHRLLEIGRASCRERVCYVV